jgi:hypothetical protein
LIVIVSRILRRYWKRRITKLAHKLLVRAGRESCSRHPSRWLPLRSKAFTGDPSITIDPRRCLLTTHLILSVLLEQHSDTATVAVFPGPSSYAHGRRKTVAKGSTERTSCPSRPVTVVCREAQTDRRLTLDVLRPLSRNSLNMANKGCHQLCQESIRMQLDHLSRNPEFSFLL